MGRWTATWCVYSVISCINLLFVFSSILSETLLLYYGDSSFPSHPCITSHNPSLVLDGAKLVFVFPEHLDSRPRVLELQPLFVSFKDTPLQSALFLSKVYFRRICPFFLGYPEDIHVYIVLSHRLTSAI
ncbi:hypothetical protein GOP47_0005631 [Adiantum capillus-veneris]|uniref:Uncharacterized protein n=1 Tax=Adiantum capillus-veneris TaxID=13818 RepID=A0A9D4ZNF3_ADICA|nr:hypothetical protein GOP47_0005631 [Adiantum capillus-veneris]